MNERLALAALFFAATTAAALAAPNLAASYAPIPYAFAPSCDLTKPIATINLMVRNSGDAPVAGVSVIATDSVNVFSGEMTLPAVAPGAEIILQLPIRYVAANRDAIPGVHTMVVRIGTQRLSTLALNVSPSFCGGTTVLTERAKSRIPPRPGVSAVAQEHSNTAALIAASLKPAIPSNLRGAAGGPDCAVHVGAIGALVCPDMIKSGDLLLVWDWHAVTGPDDIDGYRVYRVDSGLKQLVYTRTNKKDLTLVDVAKPAGGYTGKCYAVTAYAGKSESDLSPAYCAAGGAVASTIRLRAIHARSSLRFKKSSGGYGKAAESGLTVGFSYFTQKNILGDTYANEIYRTAVAFDVSSLANHRLVAAKLHVRVTTSGPRGPACVTDVGPGIAPWWLGDQWIEGRFDSPITPSDFGAELTADVTQVAAPWLRGGPNFGLVMRNSDENLSAFTEKTCETTIADPVLELTYY